MKTYIIHLIVIAAVITFIVINKNKNDETQQPDSTQTVVPREQTMPTAFEWNFEDAGEDAVGLIQTKISLTTIQQDGTKIIKNIDTVSGSCNAIDAKEEDADMLPGTTKIQCYAAGLGYWFKIVANGQTYNVLRKEFEEGSPEYTPVEREWEVVEKGV